LYAHAQALAWPAEILARPKELGRPSRANGGPFRPPLVARDKSLCACDQLAARRFD
jgi:hypothetical protein